MSQNVVFSSLSSAGGRMVTMRQSDQSESSNCEVVRPQPGARSPYKNSPRIFCACLGAEKVIGSWHLSPSGAAEGFGSYQCMKLGEAGLMESASGIGVVPSENERFGNFWRR